MAVAARRLSPDDADAAAYAQRLLADLGVSPASISHATEHPALSWARSGLMALTGNEQALMCPAPVAACADGALLALQALLPGNAELAALRGSRLLSERAVFMGLTRQGSTAPGESCRLLPTADAALAVNLSRDEDWALLPAWLESEAMTGKPGEWATLQSVLAGKQTADCVARARMLGLPVAASEWPQADIPWMSVVAQGPSRITERRPLVIDLSTLWAGPLCSHLLHMAGARVIKVEATDRPDGARRGHADFHDLLNAGKASVSLDLKSEAGRARLTGLIRQADIVIESARPRGLRQMGIVAEEWVQARPGLTWISITGYGRDEDNSQRVAFGDDAGVAAGLSVLMEAVTGQRVFVGDAIADPLTGLHAALAAWHSHGQGGGRLISLALRDVAMHCAAFDLPATIQRLRQRQAAWTQIAATEPAILPAPRRVTGKARDLGEDSHNILAEFGLLTEKEMQ